MRAAIIKNGVVDSVIMAGVDYDPGQGATLIASDTANIGDTYDGENFTPSVVPTIEQIRAAMQCSSWQLKRALTQSGLRANVEAGIAAADQDTKDMWASATTFKRLHPMIVAMITTLGITDSQADYVFELANTIQE